MDAAEMAFRIAATEKDVEQHGKVLDLVRDRAAVHEEQINGKGGLVNVVASLSKQVEGLRKALWAFAGSIMISAFTIAAALIGHA